MDIKGLAWIGNIYEKFEAMCLEMEEVMYQDTVKYVENQVQTVGASVKKFYSEVMQDLDPESHVDPVKIAAADLTLNPYVEMIQKSSSKKDPCENTEKLTDDFKVISDTGKNKTGAYKRPVARRRGHSAANYCPAVLGLTASVSGNVTSTSSFSQIRGSREVALGSLDVTLSSAAVEGNSEDANEKNCNGVIEKCVPPSGASVDFPRAVTKLLTSSSGRKQAESGDNSYSICLATGTPDAGSYTNRGVVSENGSDIKADVGLSKSVDEDVMMSHKERLDECSRDAAENDNIIDQEVEIIEKINESMLAETCVLVEEDMLHFVHNGNDKHKSYKKKLREAFSTKKRSTRKEYEKLAAQYKEQNSKQESAEGLMLAIGDSSAKTSPGHTFRDSDWELL